MADVYRNYDGLSRAFVPLPRPSHEEDLSQLTSMSSAGGGVTK